jgi:hypothetical protein
VKIRQGSAQKSVQNSWWSARPGVRSALLAVAILVALVAPALALGQRDSTGSPAYDRATAEIERDLAREAEAWERRRAWRTSAAAEEERRRSRTEHRGVTGTDALALARKHFAPVVKAPVWSPLPLDKGERLKRFVGQHGAVVETAEGRTVARTSVVPLRPQAGPGSAELADLGLEERPDGFVSSNPLVPVEIPKRLAEGVEFAREGFSVTLAGAASRDAAVESEDRVFYADELEDVDVVASPAPSGVEFAFQVRSAAAPERIPLAFELPERAELRLVDDAPKQLPNARPSGAAEIVRGGERMGLISPPLAFDADLERLEVRYEVEGDRLVVVFPHRSQDILYPALVDPVVQSWPTWDDPYGDVFRGWEFSTPWPWHFGASWGLYGDVLHIQMFGGVHYDTGMWAEWRFRAPRSSFIRRADFFAVDHWPTGHYPQGSCVLEGFWAPSRNDWDHGSWAHMFAGGPSPWYGGSGYDTNTNSCWWLEQDYRIHWPANPAPGNIMVFKLQANGSSTRSSDGGANIAAPAIELDDSDVPLISQGINPSGWLPAGRNVVHGVYAHDPGLGLYVVSHQIPLAAGGTRGDARPGYCEDGYIFACHSDLYEEFGFSTSELPSGISEVGGQAVDVLGKVTSYSSQVKVDTEPPAIALSGELSDRRGQTLTHGDYPLTINATDGNPTGGQPERRSGVRSLHVSVIGPDRKTETAVAVGPQDCPQDSCGITPVEPEHG